MFESVLTDLGHRPMGTMDKVSYVSQAMMMKGNIDYDTASRLYNS